MQNSKFENLLCLITFERDQNFLRKRSIDILSLILAQQQETPLNPQPQMRFLQEKGAVSELCLDISVSLFNSTPLTGGKSNGDGK